MVAAEPAAVGVAEHGAELLAQRLAELRGLLLLRALFGAQRGARVQKLDGVRRRGRVRGAPHGLIDERRGHGLHGRGRGRGERARRGAGRAERRPAYRRRGRGRRVGKGRRRDRARRGAIGDPNGRTEYRRRARRIAPRRIR
ncbi:MAG: hypothetical protein FJ304_01725 [Planctomycetes bacterium]|nr:hypothetical protein [Planctomycetota bacterium]